MKNICNFLSLFGPTMEYCQNAAADKNSMFHWAEVAEYCLSSHQGAALILTGGGRWLTENRCKHYQGKQTTPAWKAGREYEMKLF